MVTKGKLKMALAAEKGTDFKKLKQKKKEKEAAKRRRAENGGAEQSRSDDEEEVIAEIEEIEEEDDAPANGKGYSLEGIDDSDSSEDEVEFEAKLGKTTTQPTPRTLIKTTKVTKEASKPKVELQSKDDDDEEDEEEDEEDIPVSDLEDLDEEDREDLIPHERLTINNTTALLSSLKRIALPTAPFSLHQSIVAQGAPAAESIPDISDDLQRELAFYSQSLDAARLARTRLLAENVPFTRPGDYFAEMIKEDAHMDKVKEKLVDEAAAKKASAEARKQRDLKKFGKQVQVAKLQERQKAKRETLEKIKTLKRKRQEGGNDGGTHEADIFDVGVDSELKKHAQRSGAPGAGRGNSASGNVKRQKKNEKYGFGGKKRHAKSGDAMSSGDLSGFDAKRMKANNSTRGGRVSKSKGAASRPGKNRRKAMTGK